MQSVMTHLAPAAIGPYSQGIMMNNTLFISGQLGIDPNTGNMPEGFDAQANLVFSNIKAIKPSISASPGLRCSIIRPKRIASSHSSWRNTCCPDVAA